MKRWRIWDFTQISFFLSALHFSSKSTWVYVTSCSRELWKNKKTKESLRKEVLVAKENDSKNQIQILLFLRDSLCSINPPKRSIFYSGKRYPNFISKQYLTNTPSPPRCYHIPWLYFFVPSSRSESMKQWFKTPKSYHATVVKYAKSDQLLNVHKGCNIPMREVSEYVVKRGLWKMSPFVSPIIVSIWDPLW